MNKWTILATLALLVACVHANAVQGKHPTCIASKGQILAVGGVESCELHCAGPNGKPPQHWSCVKHRIAVCRCDHKKNWCHNMRTKQCQQIRRAG